MPQNTNVTLALNRLCFEFPKAGEGAAPIGAPVFNQFDQAEKRCTALRGQNLSDCGSKPLGNGVAW